MRLDETVNCAKLQAGMSWTRPMTTEYTVAITLSATPAGIADPKARTEVELVCGYSPHRSGSFYARNGDPGDPPEPDETWVKSVKLHGVVLAEDHPLTKLVIAWMEADDAFYESVIEKVAATQAAEAEAMYAAWIGACAKSPIG